MLENGIPEAEKKYRKRVVQELQGFYETVWGDLSSEQQEKMQEEISRQFFKDYPWNPSNVDYELKWWTTLIDFIPEEKIPKKTRLKLFQDFYNAPKMPLDINFKKLATTVQDYKDRHTLLKSKELGEYVQDNSRTSKAIRNVVDILGKQKNLKLYEKVLAQMNKNFKFAIDQLISEEARKKLETLSPSQISEVDSQLSKTVIAHAFYQPINQLLDVIQEGFKIYQQQEQQLENLGFYDKELTKEENIVLIDSLLFNSLEALEEV